MSAENSKFGRKGSQRDAASPRDPLSTVESAACRKDGQPRLLGPLSHFDVFLAIPMAALSPEAYMTQRNEAHQVECHLLDHCGFKSIYNPASAVPAAAQFDSPVTALKLAMTAMKASQLLVMLYTIDKPSSILVEAGWALAQGIPAIYFVRKPLSLPFLLHAAQLSLPNVEQFEYERIEDVLAFIDREGSRLRRLLAPQ